MPRSLAVLLLPFVLVACTKLKKDEPEPEKPPKETHVGKFTREILDLKQVRKDHPDWVEIDPEFQASDPVSTSLSASQSMPWDIAKMTFQRNCVDFYKVQNDDQVPPYSVAKKFVEQESAGLPARRPYEHYVYDDSTGALLLYLDKEHRNREYKEYGIPIPED